MKQTNEYLLHKSVNFLKKKSNQHPYVLNYRDFDMSVRWVLMKKLIALLKFIQIQYRFNHSLRQFLSDFIQLGKKPQLILRFQLK